MSLRKAGDADSDPYGSKDRAAKDTDSDPYGSKSYTAGTLTYLSLGK